jgi:hypothetical protein
LTNKFCHLDIFENRLFPSKNLLHICNFNHNNLFEFPLYRL